MKRVAHGEPDITKTGHSIRVTRFCCFQGSGKSPIITALQTDVFTVNSDLIHQQFDIFLGEV